MWHLLGAGPQSCGQRQAGQPDRDLALVVHMDGVHLLSTSDVAQCVTHLDHRLERAWLVECHPLEAAVVDLRVHAVVGEERLLEGAPDGA